MASRILLSASLVLYNNKPQMLEELLEAFEKSSVRCHLSVIDNSPNDDLSALFSLKAWITYIHNKGKNLGFGEAHNIGIEACPESDFHLVVNPDITFGPIELENMLTFMSENDDIVLLNPSIFFPDGNRQFLAKRYPTFFALFLRRFLPNGLQRITKAYMDRYEMRDMGYDKVFDVPYLSGCFMLFRSSTLKSIKGFDPKFFMYLEDADITIRASATGRAVFFPGAKVTHHWERGAYKSLKLSWVTFRSAIYLFRKHRIGLF